MSFLLGLLKSVIKWDIDAVNILFSDSNLSNLWDELQLLFNFVTVNFQANETEHSLALFKNYLFLLVNIASCALRGEDWNFKKYVVYCYN